MLSTGSASWIYNRETRSLVIFLLYEDTRLTSPQLGTEDAYKIPVVSSLQIEARKASPLIPVWNVSLQNIYYFFILIFLLINSVWL